MPDKNRNATLANPAKPRPLFAPGAVRRWASAHGLDIGERGRIPGEVLERYLARFTNDGESAA
jgi:hypothetical protein